MTSERNCEGCRFAEIYGACRHVLARYLSQYEERTFGDCGPAGRYWEPRESQDE